MTENTESLPEEQYRDLIDLEVTENATIRLESGLLYSELDTWNNDLQCGVKVHQDGTHISFSAGTVNAEELPHLYTNGHLTPEQAREIGDALYEAADNAEEAAETAPNPEEDTKSFLQRLLP